MRYAGEIVNNISNQIEDFTSSTDLTALLCLVRCDDARFDLCTKSRSEYPRRLDLLAAVHSNWGLIFGPRQTHEALDLPEDRFGLP